MSSKNKEGIEEPAFRLNYATLILLMLILIPALYIVITNLQKRSEPAVAVSPASGGTFQQPAVVNAIETAENLVKQNPSGPAFVDLGLAYYNAGRFQESIKAWENALKYEPNNDVAYCNIGAAYGALKMFDEEIAACEKALALNPNNTLARNNLNWAKSQIATK